MVSLIFSRIIGTLLGLFAIMIFFSLIKLHRIFYVLGFVVFNLMMMFIIIPMLKDQDFMADRKSGIKEWMSHRPVIQIAEPVIIPANKPEPPEPAYTPPVQKEPEKNEQNERSIETESAIEKPIDEPPVPAPKTEGSPVNANNIYHVPPSNSSSSNGEVVPRTYGSTEGVGGNYHGEKSKFGTPEKEQTVKPRVYGAPK